MNASPENDHSFSSAEEAFFRDGELMEISQASESFEDLDDGYQPVTIWQRLFGKKK